MQRNFNKPSIRKIEKIVDETPTVRTLTFSDDVLSNVKPGQFAMVWIPGVNELPMSVMISKEEGKAAFTVRTHGPSSTALYNLQVGDDTELVQKIIKKIKSITNVPIIAKVGLGTTHYLDTVDAACQAGVDGITAINTLRAMAIDVETERPILSNKIGGLSGTPIKPIAVRCVYEISSKFDIPVIGCGGISTWEDAVEFILAGASAVQLGSVIGDDTISIFSEINNGIIKYMEKKNFSTIGEFVGRAKKF